MATTTRVRVDGLRQLGAAMKKLDRAVALKGARSATAAAAKPVKNAAIRNIDANPSIDSGDLRKNVIVKRLGKNESSLTSEHIVTVRGRGKKKKNKDGTVTQDQGAPHAHLVEFGTVNMPAEPFLGPAYEQQKQNAVEAMRERLAKFIAKNTPKQQGTP